ncbi:uncharacterized protein LOC128344911 isoform X2 [Hemicordylus capensis]|uniref:uncharacterized protein LOC128344911 isoform X2 n=1 Tax=Hemicordylus capensis TaxID=884348 RepID=UPI002303EF29|nr:uncharacterized protein LOC128344911 isoform X2 [Hemicordylus capensis]
MATHFQLYKKSTFPPLLDSYLPVHCKNQNDPNQQKTETDKVKTRNNKRDLSDEEKEEIIKQALQEQHHLETYKNVYKLKNILCEHYRTLLNEKVQKQRIQIKMSNLRLQQHIQHKGKKYIRSHKVPFCKLPHDTKYLESIPQSSSYLIIGLENELTKLGILKNQQDHENFWNLTQAGIHCSKLKEKLPDIKAKMFAAKSLPLSNSTRTNPAQALNGSINSSRLKQSTASQLQPPTHHMNQQMESQPEKEQSRTQQANETCTRNRKHEQRLHYLHHMYYFSLLNMASSKRLLKQNGQFSDFRKESCVHDLMDYLFPNWHGQSAVNHKKKMEENTFLPLVGKKQQKMHLNDCSNVSKGSKEKKNMLSQQRNKDVAEKTDDQIHNISTFAQHKMIVVPLTLEDVALCYPVLEARPLGNYWTNYADKDTIITSEKY